MNKQDIIHKLLADGEHVKLECKKAQNSLPNSMWETYSAFANTYGGTILLGVVENMAEKDHTKRFSITGLENADKMRKDLWNIINSHEKVNVNLLHDEDVQIVDVDGKNVIVVNVPRADYMIRPVYINNNLSRGTYRRNHEGDYHCTEQELRMMIRDSNELGNDRMFLEYYTMDDIDIPTLERYRILFRTDNPEHVWNDIGNKDFLIQLGGYVVNRKEQTEGLTMAGLLMFGKGLPIRDRFENLRMDYIDKSNLIGDQRYSDRLTYDGTWENNLFNFIRMVLPRLTRDLPRPFQMEGVIRKDDTPQHKAVREAMTNAIIHADLMINGILKVEKYDDRFVLTNPGLLKLPVEQIYAGGESKARNQRIQAMLRMIGYGENLGSGFPLILSAWNEKHWLKPELIEQPELMQVKLILHIEDKVDKPLVSKNVTKDVTKDVTKEISERQRIILDMIGQNDVVTIPEMSQKIGVTTRTIKRDIEYLTEQGILLRNGGRKEGHWVITKK
ncbi:MAG: putative DNA binding domain-containing protein [Prevotella sp.]|jgi:predicted HTH transcriptional regulator|nr:putative DNA binding domain-containing protein [Prevotella sp.]